MAVPKSLPKAELIGTFLETFAFGVYLVLFFETLLVLRQRHRQGKPMAYLLLVSLLVFACIFQHWIADLLREITAFTGNMGQANAPYKYYAVVATKLNMWKTASYIVLTQITDLFIIYRTFVVYGRNFLVAIVPVSLWICVVVVSSWATASLATVPVGDNVLAANVTKRIKYFFILSMVLNVLCTILISARIWKIMREAHQHSLDPSRLARVLIMLIESAAVYTTYAVALIVLDAMGSPSMFIALNSISPVIGIVFSSIILRVGRGISQGDGENGGSTASLRSKLTPVTNKEISVGVTSKSSSLFSQDLRHWVHPRPPPPLYYHNQTAGSREKGLPIVNTYGRYGVPAPIPALCAESGYSIGGIPATIHVV